MKKIALAVTASLLSLAAQAEWIEWSKLEGSTLYVDAASARFFGSKAYVWTMLDFTRPVPNGDKAAIWSATTRYEIDCGSEVYRRVSRMGFSQSRGTGDRVYSSTDVGIDESARPGSPYAVLVEAACEMAAEKGKQRK